MNIHHFVHAKVDAIPEDANVESMVLYVLYVVLVQTVRIKCEV